MRWVSSPGPLIRPTKQWTNEGPFPFPLVISNHAKLAPHGEAGDGDGDGCHHGHCCDDSPVCTALLNCSQSPNLFFIRFALRANARQGEANQGVASERSTRALSETLVSGGSLLSLRASSLHF